MSLVQRTRDPIRYLRVFMGERVRQALGPHEVVYIVKTVAREILPTANLEGTCPQLGLFADWVVHDELGRSSAGQAAIARIAEALPLHGQGGRDEKWLEEEVNGGISFAALRLELLAACRRFDLPDYLFTSWEAWQRFALPLAFEVSGRPVLIPSNGKRGKEARERIAASGLPSEHQPHTLTLVHVDDDGGLIKGWWWEAEMPVGKVLVQLLLGGFRPSDFPEPAGWRPPI
jgi:hypothetical protein